MPVLRGRGAATGVVRWEDEMWRLLDAVDNKSLERMGGLPVRLAA